ncbi:carbohydrate ABC transporter permease [Butyrivibrio sp. INlla21]|uniref:carbohydrate ABC transporter permease n=1 Tax=Butyrivibrio sp. INlla21 TaxID=1520811 RepID=UPI0008EA2DE2|nr:sugar ABC transporter permease [Butyrivibrio sp. INlla21]SFU90255.1 raffinose/stachyose/melibiose transport system permease protein [Butyrivibrio sp. INlla21]
MRKKLRLSDDNVQAFLMILPFFVGFIMFSYVPIVYILRYAFTNYSGFGDCDFTGLANFVRAFKRDPDFWQSLLNTVILSAGKLAVEIPLALLLAVLLNKKLKGMAFFRVTLFLPAIISAVIIGLIFSLLFASHNGMVNGILANIGLIEKPINWFNTKWKAMLILGIASVWQNYGINMIFFLMALQSIPQELYDCASIDGATGLTRFFKITLPMIAPIFQSILLMAIVGSLKVCDLVISCTNGQPGGTTEVVMTYIYKSFFGKSGRNIEVGYASAMALITAIFLGLVTFVYLKATKKLKEYEG